MFPELNMISHAYLLLKNNIKNVMELKYSCKVLMGTISEICIHIMMI